MLFVKQTRSPTTPFVHTKSDHFDRIACFRCGTSGSHKAGRTAESVVRIGAGRTVQGSGPVNVRASADHIASADLKR